MIHFDVDTGKPMLYYYDKQHVRYACEWFFDMNKINPPSMTADLLKKLYEYEDLIICMGYTCFLKGIAPNKINFNNLINETIFINPFLSNF